MSGTRMLESCAQIFLERTDIISTRIAAGAGVKFGLEEYGPDLNIQSLTLRT